MHVVSIDRPTNVRFVEAGHPRVRDLSNLVGGEGEALDDEGVEAAPAVAVRLPLLRERDRCGRHVLVPGMSQFEERAQRATRNASPQMHCFEKTRIEQRRLAAA